MKLPNAYLALVEREKLLGYLLNQFHPDNGGKASFFIELGFSCDRWMLLARAFVELAEENEIVASMESMHGIKYIVDGRMSCRRVVNLRESAPSG